MTRFAIHSLFVFPLAALFIAAIADADVTSSQDYNPFVGHSILVREIGAKFLKDNTEVLAEPGKLYVVERAEGSQLWVRGQAGWIDGNSVLVANGASEFFTGRLHTSPTAENYLSRGQAWSAEGNFQRALVDYEACLRLKPDSAIAHSGRGNCLLNRRSYKSAIAAYSQALEIHPDLAAALNNRGNAWRAVGKFDQALIDYDATLKLRPGAPAVLFSRGVCLSAQGDQDAAIEAFDRTLEARPKHSDAMNERGLAYQRKGEFAKAIEDYTAATEADPDHFEAYNNLAWLLANCKQAQLREPARAVEVATRACKITGFRNWYCVGTLAASYARSGKFKEAVFLQKKAIGLLPKNATATDQRDYQQRLKIYQAGLKSA